MYFLPLSTSENHVVTLSICWQVLTVSLGLPKLPKTWNSKASQSVLNVYHKGRLCFVFAAFERSVRICILQQNHSPVLLCIWWTFQWIVIKVECVGRKYHLIRELVPSFGRAWFWWNQMLCLRWLPLDKCTVSWTGNWVSYQLSLFPNSFQRSRSSSNRLPQHLVIARWCSGEMIGIHGGKSI